MRGALLLAVLALLAASGCSSGDDPGGDRREPARRLTLWIGENQPERVQAMRANLADFTRRTAISVDLVVLGDDELVPKATRAEAAGALPDVLQVGMAEAHAFVHQGILDAEAAQEVVGELGEDTFSARALSLLTTGGNVAAVPSDGWGQLLIYRKDLFDAAGLPAPRTLDDVRRAAARLNRDGMAGITLATTPEGFMAETFEHIALAAGCRLVEPSGEVALDSPQCRRAFAYYTDLARSYSPGTDQDVDTTRKLYFDGRAAMILWSPFLLDALAGLRDDALPTCPRCAADPAFLAENSGLVGPLAGDGEPAQFGNITGWGIASGADTTTAGRLVRYLLTDGYLRWLALSPQGKYPVRAGETGDPERYVRGWAELESGVERRAPLRRFYSQAAIDSLGEGVRSFRRWAFEDDEAALLGAMGGPQPVSKALAAAIRGEITPDQAAARAQRSVERLQASLGG